MYIIPQSNPPINLFLSLNTYRTVPGNLEVILLNFSQVMILYLPGLHILFGTWKHSLQSVAIVCTIHIEQNEIQHAELA